MYKIARGHLWPYSVATTRSQLSNLHIITKITMAKKSLGDIHPFFENELNDSVGRIYK